MLCCHRRRRRSFGYVEWIRPPTVLSDFVCAFEICSSQAVNDIKDRIDIVHTPDFVNFTTHVFPVLRELILSKIPPQSEDNDENKVRHTILEIFSRFPTTETLRSIVMDLISIGLRVLQEDNEENAITALKIMFDLHKTYRPSLEHQVQVDLFFCFKISCFAHHVEL